MTPLKGLKTSTAGAGSLQRQNQQFWLGHQTSATWRIATALQACMPMPELRGPCWTPLMWETLWGQQLFLGRNAIPLFHSLPLLFKFPKILFPDSPYSSTDPSVKILTLPRNLVLALPTACKRTPTTNSWNLIYIITFNSSISVPTKSKMYLQYLGNRNQGPYLKSLD